MRTVLQIMTMLMLTIISIGTGFAVHPACAAAAAIVCIWECKTWGDRLTG